MQQLLNFLEESLQMALRSEAGQGFHKSLELARHGSNSGPLVPTEVVY
jgi:hypothetical protein